MSAKPKTKKTAPQPKPLQFWPQENCRRKFSCRNFEEPNWNFRSRFSLEDQRFLGLPLNRRYLIKVGNKIHILSCHSKRKIEKKWRAAANQWHKAHFGSDRISVRYANMWSCHAWM